MTDTEALACGSWPRGKDAELRLRIERFRGKYLADLRRYWMDGSGRWIPTQKGARIELEELPDIIKALQYAYQLAGKRGLIKQLER